MSERIVLRARSIIDGPGSTREKRCDVKECDFAEEDSRRGSQLV